MMTSVWQASDTFVLQSSSFWGKIIWPRHMIGGRNKYQMACVRMKYLKWEESNKKLLQSDKVATYNTITCASQ